MSTDVRGNGTSAAKPLAKLPILPLSRQGDFRRIYAKGRRLRTSLVTAVVLGREEPPEGIRAAYVVSKKVAARAVKRNLLRRRMREAFRLLLRANPPAVDVILIAHRDAAAADYRQVHAAVRQILGRIGLVVDAAPKEG